MVVFVLPVSELPGEFPGVAEGHAAIKLFLVSSLTPLDLPVAFRTAPGDEVVHDAEVVEGPSEVGSGPSQA